MIFKKIFYVSLGLLSLGLGILGAFLPILPTVPFVFMGISILLTDHPHARIAIAVMWVLHVILFVFRIPTI